MKKITVVFFSFLCSLQLFSQTEGWKPRTDSLLESLASQHRFSGSLTLEKAGKTIYSFEHNEMDRGTHIYRIGSITKMLTSIVVFQLVEEGKISLKDTLAKWFPQIKYAEGIRLGNLLSHTSGIYDLTHAADYYVERTQAFTRAQILEKILAHKPYAKPDEEVSYCNSNYILLGYIIEDVTGKSYAENIRERIAQPLGLKHTYCETRAEEAGKRELSYHWDGEHWLPDANSDPSLPGAAGAVVSTTEEIGQIITALFQGKLIKPESLAGMQSLRNKSMGHGLFLAPFSEHNGFGHTGRIDEFRSSLVYFPDDSLAVAFCSNGINMSMNEVLKGVLSYYFGKEYVPPVFPKTDVTEPPLTDFLGNYKVKFMLITIGKFTISPAGKGHLFMGMMEKPDESPKFLMERQNEMSFWVRENNGQIVFEAPRKGVYHRARLVQGKMSMKVKRLKKSNP